MMKLSLVFSSAALALTLVLGQGANAQTVGQFERAIMQDNASALRDMLKAGFNPNTKTGKGEPGLVMALHEGSFNAAMALADAPNIDINATNSHGETALMMAAWAGRVDIAKQLVAHGAVFNKSGWTALHYAASKGQLEMMRYLLQWGAEIDAESPNHSTPLMLAVGYSTTEAVKLLLDSGADISKRNLLGMSALDFAKHYDRPDAIKLLTEAERRKGLGGKLKVKEPFKPATASK